MTEDAIDQIRESRCSIDELLTAIYRLQDLDRDTDDIQLQLQTQIDREFRRIDDALVELDEKRE